MFIYKNWIIILEYFKVECFSLKDNNFSSSFAFVAHFQTD